MSGFTRTPLVVEAMRVGAVDFLEKPFGLGTLTARERTVFNEFSTGASTKQVADILALSPKTVETYRTRLLSKLDVNTPYALCASPCWHRFLVRAHAIERLIGRQNIVLIG
jgi:FixJ family two-component response regulator